MPVHRDVVRDKSGNVIPSCTVTVNDAGTSTASSIYTDSALSTAKDNPFTSGTDGSYEFYAAAAKYDITITKTGISDISRSDVEIPSASQAPSTKAAATTPGNFSADYYITWTDDAGTTVYIPAMTATW